MNRKTNYDLTEFANPQEAFAAVRELLGDWQETNRRQAGKIFALYLANYREQTKDLLREVAESPSWRVREEAAKIWGVALTWDFDYYSWYQELLETGSTNLRRAVLVGTKYSMQEQINDRVAALLRLIAPLRSVCEEYIRKNFGSFTIGSGFLRLYPNRTIQKLRQWKTEDTEQTLWNVAKAFASSGGTTHWPQGKEILYQLAGDDRRYVWKAASSALHYLGRRKPEEFIPMLEKWKQEPKREDTAEDALYYIRKNID